MVIIFVLFNTTIVFYHLISIILFAIVSLPRFQFQDKIFILRFQIERNACIFRLLIDYQLVVFRFC